VPSTFTVTNLLDDGSAGSLRYEIAAANAAPGADVINFAPGLTGTITLTSGELAITDSLSITGPGTGLLTISGNSASRVFNVAAGTTDALSGLTVANGRNDINLPYFDGRNGAGILNDGTLTVSNCSISNNVTNTDPTSTYTGGGIANYGSLTVLSSTLSGNTAGGGNDVNAFGGGGIWNSGVLTVTACTLSSNSGANGGGILSTNTATIQDSTFSANQATFGGGGFELFGGQATLSNCTIAGNSCTWPGITSSTVVGGGIGAIYGGSLTATNCTISGNSSTGHGGGVGDATGTYPATFTLHNTIVAGNSAPTHQGPDIYANIHSLGYNLIGNPQGGSGFVATDLLKGNPMLGPLQNNGGPTQTMALLLGSPALDAGDPSTAGLPAFDQRGPGYARVAAGRVDIGAFEGLNTATHFAIALPSTIKAGVPFSLTVTALDAFGRVAIGYTGTVVFSSSGPGATLPRPYTFTTADQGVHTFTGIVLPNKGKVSLTVTDSLDASLSASVQVQVT
jgi:hypothetical protein